MKRIFAIVLLFTIALLNASALADIDLSGMSFDDLIALQQQVNLALWESDGWQEVTVPVGIYKVGEDIPAGEYQVEASSGLGYIEVSSDSRHQIEGIITNDNFEGNKYITVQDGQYLTLSNGAQIKA